MCRQFPRKRYCPPLKSLIRSIYVPVVICLALVCCFNRPFNLAVAMAPLLNDVATNLNDVPEFVSKPSLNPLPTSFKTQIFNFPLYKEELQALSVEGNKADVFEACKSSCSRMPRWTLTNVNAHRGTIEGFATTFLLRFKDDFVIRLQEQGGKTRLDMCAHSHPS
jgi:hypothetical protein